MPGQQLIMHEITNIAGRNQIFLFPKKKLSYYENLCSIQYNYCRFHKD